MDDKQNWKFLAGVFVSLCILWAIVFYIGSPYVEANKQKRAALAASNQEWMSIHQCVKVESNRPFHSGKFIVERDGYMCDDKIVHYECITCNHKPEDQCSCS